MWTRRWSSIGLVLIILVLFFGVSWGVQEVVKVVKPDIMKVNPWDVFEGIVTIPSYIVIVLLVLLPSDAWYNLRLSIFQRSSYVREIIISGLLIILVMAVVGFVAYDPTDSPTRNPWNDFNWGNYLSVIIWGVIIFLYNVLLRLGGGPRRGSGKNIAWLSHANIPIRPRDNFCRVKAEFTLNVANHRQRISLIVLQNLNFHERPSIFNFVYGHRCLRKIRGLERATVFVDLDQFHHAEVSK